MMKMMLIRIFRKKEAVSIKVETSQTHNQTIHCLIMMLIKKVKIINNKDKRIKRRTKTCMSNLNLILKEKKRESSKEHAGKRS